MEFLNCVKERRSIRKFTTDKIEHDKLERIVKLASFSPSWKNSQIVRYIVVEDKNLKEQIANNCVLGLEHNCGIIKNAPALVVVTTVSRISGYERDGSFTTSKGDRWEMFDAGIAAQTFCLAAHSEGLGTVIMGIFDEDRICETMKISETQKVAALIAIGYPNEEPTMPKRKEVNELISYR